MFKPFTTAIVLLNLVLAPIHAGENWPGWRGPTGMGLSDERDLSLTWGGKGEDNIRWKTPLFPSDKVRRDQNQSSPAVWGKQVFVTLSYWPEGISEKSIPEHHVLCFDADSGKKVWDTSVAAGPWKLSDLRGGYTAPTPACDGKRLYVLFGSAVAAALDMQGNTLWRQEILPHNFDVAWAASPVVYDPSGKDAVVLVVCDQIKGSKSSSIYAFEGATGTVRWQKKRPVDWAHSTPLLATVGDKVQLLTATHNGPQGLDPASGELIWSYQSGQQIGDTVTPTYRDGMVYIDSGRGSMGVAIDATGKGDVSKTHLKWKVPSVASGFSSPILIGDFLYRLHGSDLLTCWRWTTGEEVFKARLEGLDTAVSPIATSDGRIYCASAGKSYVLKAGARLEVLARNELGDPSRASPAVAGGRIYIKGGRYLYCIGK